MGRARGFFGPFRCRQANEKPEAAVHSDLNASHRLWARFNPTLMMEGVGVIALCLVVPGAWGIFTTPSSSGTAPCQLLNV
jgi:hypothetical protein